MLLQRSVSFVMTPIFCRFLRVPRSEKKTSHPTLFLHFKQSQYQGNKLQTWVCYLPQKLYLTLNSEIMSRKTRIPLPIINNICIFFCLLLRRCLKPTCSSLKNIMSDWYARVSQSIFCIYEFIRKTKSALNICLCEINFGLEI